MRVGTMGGKARRHGGPRGSPKLVSPLEFTDPEVILFYSIYIVAAYAARLRKTQVGAQKIDGSPLKPFHSRLSDPGRARKSSILPEEADTSIKVILVFFPIPPSHTIYQSELRGGGFFSLFFSSSFTSICNPLGYDRLQLSLPTCSGLALCPFLCPFVLFLAAIIALSATFGLNPPEFIQATLHLLGRSSFPILAPFLLLLLLLLLSLFAGGLFLDPSRVLIRRRQVSYY